MVKSISISEPAYEWLLKKSSRQTIEAKKNVSIADVVDELIKKGG